MPRLHLVVIEVLVAELLLKEQLSEGYSGSVSVIEPMIEVVMLVVVSELIVVELVSVMELVAVMELISMIEIVMTGAVLAESE
ncbi:MAG: hypothetical protein JNL58_24170 [Planctomyces sp.]|nr:hypothetical protein [Planctomyces sp.]